MEHRGVLKVLHWFLDESSHTLWLVYNPNKWTSLYEVAMQMHRGGESEGGDIKEGEEGAEAVASEKENMKEKKKLTKEEKERVPEVFNRNFMN